MFVVSLPVIFINAPTTATKSTVELWSTNDVTGVTLYCLGMLVETSADLQKFNWKDNPDNNGRWCEFGESYNTISQAYRSIPAKQLRFIQVVQYVSHIGIVMIRTMCITCSPSIFPAQHLSLTAIYIIYSLSS